MRHSSQHFRMITRLLAVLFICFLFSEGYGQTTTKKTTTATTKKTTTTAKKPAPKKKPAVKRQRSITIKTLELRKEPAVVAPSLATMKIGEKVTVLEKVDGKWVKVSYKGKGKNGKVGTHVGYIYEQYLSK